MDLQHAMESGSAAGSIVKSECELVDLTQEHPITPHPTPANSQQEDDVQITGSTYAYNAFPQSSSASTGTAATHDPYAAAWRSATSTDDCAAASSSPSSSSSSSSTPGNIRTDEFARLSREQQAVVLAVLRGESVFFSGCAGTGKSHLIKLLRDYLPRDSTFFTASTGLAAVNIGGTTLHSFAGVGLGEGSAENLGYKAKGGRAARLRWLSCKVLVIDEISMIAGSFFDKIEHVARFVRGNEQPFGGIQLVLSGDFLQLPPVKSTVPTFKAKTWEKCIQVKIVLTQVFRQKGDPTFINLLHNLRMGDLPLKDQAILKRCHYNNLQPMRGVLPTKLNALKRDTEEENMRHLNALSTSDAEVLFEARDTGVSEGHLELLRKNCPAPAKLRLKVGAQVMLLLNIDTSAGLCNGSRGRILDFVRIHCEQTFGGYDADSNGHAADQDGLMAQNDAINQHEYFANPDNGGFGGRMVTPGGDDGNPLIAPVGRANADEVIYLPRVAFENGVTCVIESDKFEISVQDQVMARRRQVPLTLAWALTIHKSQGMTLESAEINAQGMFETGQLYVAISRVKTLQGLKLMNFTMDGVRTDKNVVAWYRQLEKETRESTEQLLKDVDSYFPELQAYLEEQKKIKEQEEINDEKAKKEGTSTNVKREADLNSAAAAASSPSCASAASFLSPSSSGVKVKSNSGAGHVLAFQPASTLLPASSSSSSASASSHPYSSIDAHVASMRGFTSASSMLVKREGGSARDAAAAAAIASYDPIAAGLLTSSAKGPQAFRSPLKNPRAAAASNAIAAAQVGAASPSTASNSSSPNGRANCCVCASAAACYIMLDCMHACLCAGCQKNFHAAEPGAVLTTANRCPICQCPINQIKRFFF